MSDRPKFVPPNPDWLPGEDMYTNRARRIKDGKAKWLELTADWSEEEREWAWKFIASISQDWG